MEHNPKQTAAPLGITLPDDALDCVWRCPECGEEARVKPDFYDQNGTPICVDCDVDMRYVRTELVEPAGTCEDVAAAWSSFNDQPGPNGQP